MASVESEVFAVHGRVRSRVCVALTVALVGALVVGGPSAADGPGSTRRVSVDSAGTQAQHGSSGPAVSADGRYVAFDSAATNLVAGDTNSAMTCSCTTPPDRDHRPRQRRQRRHRRRNDSAATSRRSRADGRYVAFDSAASNLVAGDTNGTQ